MSGLSIRIERNTAVDHPPHQKWRGWLVDEHGDEWTWFFARNRHEARKHARKTRELIREGVIT